MTRDLTGKVAFVTGSGRGLGRAIAHRLAELGADLAIHDLTWDAPAKYGEAADLGAVREEFAKYGIRSTAVTGNIGDQEAVRKMRADIEVHARQGGNPGELRRRRHRGSRRQARSKQRARHSAGGYSGADEQQPDRYDAGLPDVRARDGPVRAGKRGEHRLLRRA